MINRIVIYIARLRVKLRIKLIRLHTQCLRMKLRYKYWRAGFTQAQASAAITDSHDWVLSLSDEKAHEIFEKIRAGEPLPYDPQVP